MKAGKGKTMGEMYGANTPKTLKIARSRVTGMSKSERKKQNARISGSVIVYFWGEGWNLHPGIRF